MQAGHDDPHIENAARTGRYRLLGEACKQHNLDLLLTAHHADDQAATLLLRMVNDYTGNGLRGIKTAGNLPECHGMYGVHNSGRPVSLNSQHAFRPIVRGNKFTHMRKDAQSNLTSALDHMRIESGGVALGRPLLEFTKEELKDECVTQNVTWVEDETNQDKSYATRNTLNSLMSSDLLPTALHRDRLVQLAANISMDSQAMERACGTFLKDCRVKLDPAAGTLKVDVSQTARAFLQEHKRFRRIRLKCHVLATLVSMVMPHDTLDMRSMQHLVDNFCDLEPASLRMATSRSVFLKYVGRDENHIKYLLGRCNPLNKPAERMLNLRPVMPADKSTFWTPWQLWDSRYWIRIGCGKAFTSETPALSVRYLTSEEPKYIPDDRRETFTRALRRARLPGAGTRALPVLVVADADKAAFPSTKHSLATPKGDVVVALPTMSWSIPELQDVNVKDRADHTWLYEVRYKAIDSPHFKMTETETRPELDSASLAPV